MKTSLVRGRDTITITFVPVGPTVGEIFVTAKRGDILKVIGHDKDVSVGMFYDLKNRFVKKGLVEQ